MASVTLKNVNKIYDGKVHAVQSADLEISDREFVVLVGPSGCGKSTLLRMVAGLEDITSGEIYIGDRLVNHVAPKDRDIAMVFQNYALYPHMSVYDNMAFGLKLRRTPSAEIKKSVESAAELLGIREYLDRKPKALSGGQRQRVAVGRAIVRNPAVFLFDEPLSNLDAKLRVQMRIEISKLHRRLGTTMIYVTHDQVEAMTMGDRIVVLNDGKIQQVDTPLNLYEHPLNRFVAGFIGSPAMNFFHGELTGNSSISFTHANFRVPVAVEAQSKLNNYRNKPVVLGIRPEHILLKDKSFENDQMQAVLEVVEPMGNETYAHFRLNEEGFTVRCGGEQILEPTKTYNLSIEKGRIHLFDTETEVRIN